VDQIESLVQAAHLIPFEVSPNDKPTNGIALCPIIIGRWTVTLIAPCPDNKKVAGIWRVNKGWLDHRIEGHRDPGTAV